LISLPSRLYVICDGEVCSRAGWDLVDFASACIDGGARFLQIRAKQLTARALLDTSTAIVARAGRSGALVVVNDRADIARLSGAAGVHVGQDDLEPTAVRRLLGKASVIGLSTHTRDQIDSAAGEPVTYVAVGPVFSSATKDTGYDAVGLERVSYAAARLHVRGLPVVAIGGITLETAEAVIGAGADSVAAIGALLTSGDPAARVRAFLSLLGGPAS
jgi:thiamine-phosphate pyrophosphorylase